MRLRMGGLRALQTGAAKACAHIRRTVGRRSRLTPERAVGPGRSEQPPSDRGWFCWRIMRVPGRSMAPTLDDGDHVLLKSCGHFRRRRPGDVACIRRGDGPM